MDNKSSKVPKQLKLARYGIDILAVYTSDNETPVPLDSAMAKIHNILSQRGGTSKLKIQKCTLQIWGGSAGSYTIRIKSQDKNKLVESFTTKSMGMPQIGQLSAKDLVFLPVLNKDYKSELFVFHPNSVTAQEVVIRLVQLLQVKEAIVESPLQTSTPPSTPPLVALSPHDNHRSTPQIIEPDEQPRLIYKPSNNRIVEQNELVKSSQVKPNTEFMDGRSEYSLSSTFFNNWYCKVEQMVCNTPASLYQGSDYGSSINAELHLLNRYLKEIRGFMNTFYEIMRKSMHDTSVENETLHRVVTLPSKSSFVEIVQKIKYSLNLASVHESRIKNPNSKEIVNQLLLILRILSDATLTKDTGQSDLLIGIKDPIIIDTTVTYLTENLSSTNKEFWISLRENYGYIGHQNMAPLGLHRTVIDEFEIRQEVVKPDYEPEPFRSYERTVDWNDHRRRSPDRIFDHESHRRNDRTNDNRQFRHYGSDNDLRPNYSYPRRKLTLSQSQINLPEKPRYFNDFDDYQNYRNYPQMQADEEILNYHLPDSAFSIQQSTERIIPMDNGYSYRNASTWRNTQDRLIDAVRLRNGRLMQITRDRPAQNPREIAVSSNEVVELLTDYGDTMMVKNALGEVGHCPSSITEHLQE